MQIRVTTQQNGSKTYKVFENNRYLNDITPVDFRAVIKRADVVTKMPSYMVKKVNYDVSFYSPRQSNAGKKAGLFPAFQGFSVMPKVPIPSFKNILGK